MNRRARTLFEELVELEAGEREIRLSALRGEAPELADQVDALLAADRAAGGDAEGRLDQPVGKFAPEVVEAWLAHEELPEHIGPYRVVSLLGRGGMGEVFLAERDDGQFEQVVALKRMRRGLDSPEIARRFWRERQILARLEHPNIARLLDGGLATDGRPYFALERVVGEPIVSYAESRQLSIEARLKLLVTACRAVDSAHRQLVVHRDIKPAHILVTADGTVKLLDFGIAKLLEEELPQGATLFEHRALTPGYAAPEQILGEPVTTTTDVYALGVVLYELLTGLLPHRRESRTLAELVAGIETETLERPSVAVRRQAAGSEAEVRQRSKRLAGDLDTIVARALDRQAERRYPSAGALADDLERFLAGRPVEARPDTWGYRAAKFLGRHRFSVAAGAVAALALVAALVVAVVEARRAAVAARQAEENAREARAQAGRAERVKSFLVAVFSEANPMRRKRDTPLAPVELVRLGVTKAREELAGEPLLQTEVLSDFAALLSGMGEAKEAEVLAEQMLARCRELETGRERPVTAKTLHQLADMLSSRHEFERAAALLDEELGLYAASGRAESLEATKARASLTHNLGLQGHFEPALALARQVVADFSRLSGPDHPDTVLHHLTLAELLRVTGQPEEAEGELRYTLPRLEALHGPGHLKVALARLNLGALLEQMGRLREAEVLYEQANTRMLEANGEHDEGYQHTLLVLGRLRRELGDVAAARRLFTKALALRQQQEDFRAGGVEVQLGWCDLAERNLGSAAGHFESARSTLVARGRQEIAAFHLAALGLGEVELEAGRLDAAGRWIVPAAEQLLAQAEPLSDQRLTALNSLGVLARARGQLEAAMKYHQEGLELARQLYRGSHPTLAELALQLAADLAAKGDVASRRLARQRLSEARGAFTSLSSTHPRLRLVNEVEHTLGED